MDFIVEFIEKMRLEGCGPANPSLIVGDDKKYRYQIEDEKGLKKSGRYQLRIDCDFAVGWFIDFRQGQTHKFHSQASKSADRTPEQQAAFRAEREAAMKAQKDQQRADHAKAARKAAFVWEKALQAGDTPYLQRKGCKLNGARIWRDSILVVPVKIGGKLTSLQFIAPDGSKRFLAGSELVGGYFSIAAKGDDFSRIYITEGFATCCSVREAVGGFPVVSAFNAGNLPAVAEALRAKYPEAKLVLAADNDRFTSKKPADTPWNPGVEYAIAAAQKAGNALVAYPSFEPADTSATDYNDAMALYGVEFVRQSINAAAQPEDIRVDYAGRAGEGSSGDSVQPPAPSGAQSGDSEYEYGHMPPEPPIDVYSSELPSIRDMVSEKEWKRLVLRNAKGEIKSSSLQNAILFLRYHDAFRGIFAYNLFHNNLMIVRCPPWEKADDFRARRIDDVAITCCAAELEKYGMNMGTDKVFKAIQATAMEVQFHPARDYFNSLVWDRTPRLATWLRYYLGCENEPDEYLAFVGTKWMVAAVYRVFHPGKKFDQVLVIEGIQGVGKSTALRYLATFGRDTEESYFTDGINIAQLDNKDTTMKLQGSIIIELAELSGFSKKEDEALKGWIGQNDDDARLPFERTVTKFGRQFVLAATTNLTTYLKDPTGNRRYWPVYSFAVDLAAIKADREQLWAEAVYLYRNDYDIIPTPEEAKLAKIECEKRLSQDSWTDTVLTHVRDILDRRGLSYRGFKIAEVMTEMGLALRDRDDRAARRISAILQIAGYENKAMWNPDTKKTERFWVMKDGIL